MEPHNAKKADQNKNTDAQLKFTCSYKTKEGKYKEENHSPE